MTAKKFKLVQVVLTFVIALVASWSIVSRQYVLPIVVFVVGLSILLYVRRSVTEIIADERDRALGGRSSLVTIQIYSWMVVVVTVVLYGLRDANPLYESIAKTLVYSLYALLLIYSGVFRYLDRLRDK